MNKTIYATSFFMLLSLFIIAQDKIETLHDFKVKSIDGKEFNMAQLKGKKALVVNTASLCGLTPQYKELELLYQRYKEHNFTIIGFPANNFGEQEPGSNKEIAEFCSKNYGVTFPMMSKISVKGKDIAPVYEWLTQKSKNGKEDAEVSWNFQKFMIDENGHWVGYVKPQESPLSDTIIKWINEK